MRFFPKMQHFSFWVDKNRLKYAFEKRGFICELSPTFCMRRWCQPLQRL